MQVLQGNRWNIQFSPVPVVSWQSGLTFDNLDPETTYYVFACTEKNATYSTGVAQVSAEIITYAIPTVSVIWDDATANGTPNTVGTTLITLLFSATPENLSIDDITVTGATKVELLGSTNPRVLVISNIIVEQGETIRIEIANLTGFTITPSFWDIAINRLVTVAHSITINLAPVSPSITTTSLPDSTVGDTYSQTLTANGDATITWSADSGALLTGLTLDSGTGIISGAPTTRGTFIFGITATNDVGSDTISFTIIITSSSSSDGNGGGSTGDITYPPSIKGPVIVEPKPEPMPDEEKPFLDLENHYAYMVGYPDGTFNPNGSITSAEFASITIRFATSTTGGASAPFADISGH